MCLLFYWNNIQWLWCWEIDLIFSLSHCIRTFHWLFLRNYYTGSNRRKSCSTFWNRILTILWILNQARNCSIFFQINWLRSSSLRVSCWMLRIHSKCVCWWLKCCFMLSDYSVIWPLAAITKFNKSSLSLYIFCMLRKMKMPCEASCLTKIWKGEKSLI